MCIQVRVSRASSSVELWQNIDSGSLGNVEALTHMHTLNQRLNQSHSGDKTKQTTPSALSLSRTHSTEANQFADDLKKDASGLMLSQHRSVKNAAQMAKSHTQLGETRPAILELIPEQIKQNKHKKLTVFKRKKTVNFGRQKFIFRSYKLIQFFFDCQAVFMHSRKITFISHKFF